MGKNLRGKSVSIIAILVVFVYGIFFGINAPKLGSLKSLITNNIHLGLDLKGGAHLVLAVHVEEAVTSETDRDVARLQTAFQQAGIQASVGKSDPANPNTIVISGIPAAKLSDARGIMDSNDYANYQEGTLPDGSETLTMKQAGDQRPECADAADVDRYDQRAREHAGRDRADGAAVWAGRQPDTGGAAGHREPGAGGGGDPVDVEAGGVCGGERTV